MVCSIRFVHDVNTMHLGFFFRLSKIEYVICWFAALFSDRLKLIVHTVYGNPKFLAVKCLLSSGESILLRTINSCKLLFFLFVKRPLTKKQTNKQTDKQAKNNSNNEKNNWQNHENFADSKESCRMFVIYWSPLRIKIGIYLSFLYLPFRLLSFYPRDL